MHTIILDLNTPIYNAVINKCLQVDDMLQLILLMSTKNINGPKTVHCETSE